MNKVKVEAIVKTYARAAVASIIALYVASPDQPLKNYFAAGLAAVAGPVLKALDVKSTDFGKGSK